MRILHEQCEASITYARLNRNTQELFDWCAPRLTFTLLTIGLANSSCCCSTCTPAPVPHTVPQIVGIFIVRQFAWLGRLEGRLFILSHWEHNKTREKEREREWKREHGTADDQSFPGNRMKMTMPGIRPGVGEREKEREGASWKFNIEIKV